MTLPRRLADALDRHFQHETPEKIALAVSGGGDSMALMHLAALWAQGRGVAVFVATVDHGLRAESAAEAECVAGAAQSLSLRHQTLRWTGWDGQGNLQDAARIARRTLIEDWAEAHDIDTVLTGHTADDQAETVLMRLARGSGVDGLAGIPAHRRHGIDWLRPLLGIRRGELRDYLRADGVDWVDDPSNDDPRFDRVKARQMLGALSGLGLTVQRLGETARHMQAAQQVLDDAMRALASDAVTQDHGDLLIDRALFMQAAAETRTRLLARALSFLSGNPYRPRFAPLSALAEQQEGTLHGCRMVRSGKVLRLFREYSAVRDAECDTTRIWDGRWRLSGPHDPALTIRALGPEGARLCPDRQKAALPHVSLPSTPAIWRDNTLICAPLAGFGAGWRAILAQNRADFLESLNSH